MRSAIRQVSSVALLLLAAAWMSQPVSAAFRFVSGVTAVTQTSAGVELELGADGVARVEFHFADTVRVRWNPGGVFSSRRTGSVVGPADVLSSVQVYDGADAVYLLSGAATVIIVKSGMRIILLRPDGSLVNASLPAGFGWDPDNGLVVTQHHALPGEAYFGLGQRGGPVNRRGRSFYLFNVDWAGYGELSDPLYSGTPSILRGERRAIAQLVPRQRGNAVLRLRFAVDRCRHPWRVQGRARLLCFHGDEPPPGGEQLHAAGRARPASAALVARLSPVTLRLPQPGGAALRRADAPARCRFPQTSSISTSTIRTAIGSSPGTLRISRRPPR